MALGTLVQSHISRKFPERMLNDIYNYITQNMDRFKELDLTQREVAKEISNKFSVDFQQYELSYYLKSRNIKWYRPKGIRKTDKMNTTKTKLTKNTLNFKEKYAVQTWIMSNKDKLTSKKWKIDQAINKCQDETQINVTICNIRNLAKMADVRLQFRADRNKKCSLKKYKGLESSPMRMLNRIRALEQMVIKLYNGLGIDDEAINALKNDSKV